MMSFLKGFNRLALILVLIAGLGLASCAEKKIVEERVAASTSEADRALAALSPKSPVAQPLMIDQRPYYGSAAIPITNGSPLPAQFEQSNSIVMTFARPVTQSELMRMVQAVTGMRASASGSGAGEGEEATFIPSDGEQVAGGRVVWQGRLSDLLNQAADVFGAGLDL